MWQRNFFINPRVSIKPSERKFHASKCVRIYSVVLLRNILGNETSFLLSFQDTNMTAFELLHFENRELKVNAQP